MQKDVSKIISDLKKALYNFSIEELIDHNDEINDLIDTIEYVRMTCE